MTGSSDKQYQAIVFDLDDTLIILRGCEAEALKRTLSDAGLLGSLPEDFSQVSASYAGISVGYWAARTRDGATQYTREQVVEHSFRDFLATYSLDARLSGGLAAQFWSAFCRSTALNPGAENVLKRLSQRFRLGMITNGYSDSQRGRLDAAGLVSLFDPLLISAEVGVEKPDAAIFEMALAALQAERDRVLYVGDSIGHDHQGCLNAGIDFCHYCPKQGEGDLPAVRFSIGHLEELIPILLPGAR